MCLRMLSLDVPTAVMRGESIWLNCTLDLESDDLYSVKWYKNDVEFYRYLPRDNPAGQKSCDVEHACSSNVLGTTAAAISASPYTIRMSAVARSNSSSSYCFGSTSSRTGAHETFRSAQSTAWRNLPERQEFHVALLSDLPDNLWS
ncbi:uncharacterized protein TNCV_2206531 [Trichonephila clavipes]|uniref:Ig-like domain-containing protein n=1 Tax=Trichonephila clavipes TaxID=2585209 RepID=A0A8X6S0H6_TRICX|nr:uncharacterized protein TNCV_2206531 [Trichonephila clavipes]